MDQHPIVGIEGVDLQLRFSGSSRNKIHVGVAEHSPATPLIPISRVRGQLLSIDITQAVATLPQPAIQREAITFLLCISAAGMQAPFNAAILPM